MKIPGLAHEVELNVSGGVHLLELKLRGDIIATTPIKSRNEMGIRKALDTLVVQAEIAHQIQGSILDNLAKKLLSESGYLDEEGAGTMGAGGDTMASLEYLSPEITSKLDEILSAIKMLDTRLQKLEEKWG